jgi:hypothetical protein
VSLTRVNDALLRVSIELTRNDTLGGRHQHGEEGQKGQEGHEEEVSQRPGSAHARPGDSSAIAFGRGAAPFGRNRRRGSHGPPSMRRSGGRGRSARLDTAVSPGRVLAVHPWDQRADRLRGGRRAWLSSAGVSESCPRNRMAQADVDDNGSATQLTSKEKKELAELRRDSPGWRWTSRSSSGRPRTSPVRMSSQTSLSAGP